MKRLKSRYHRSGGRTGIANERQYVFQGLLRCTRCGRRMHCHTIKGVAYYNCRGNDRADPCKRGVREDGLVTWAEQLFTALDEYRPAELAAEVDRLLDKDAPAPPRDALAQLDRTIDRLGQRFDWGHIDEAKYREEWDRLQATTA
ncbi:MAG TPA: zinc ribbon domain-containing protein [Candidatus Eisenbacteria bacterium]|nr:zinc ribbon domain-containing protein [Candidatus Eisenbacteria bacterium]